MIRLERAMILLFEEYHHLNDFKLVYTILKYLASFQIFEILTTIFCSSGAWPIFLMLPVVDVSISVFPMTFTGKYLKWLVGTDFFKNGKSCSQKQ